MAMTLNNIPLFVLEHKWSSDIESNADDEFPSKYDSVKLVNNCKTHQVKRKKILSYSFIDINKKKFIEFKLLHIKFIHR